MLFLGSGKKTSRPSTADDDRSVSHADLLLASMGQAVLCDANDIADGVDGVDASSPDPLETDWTDAIDARYGHGVEPSSKSNSSKPKSTGNVHDSDGTHAGISIAFLDKQLSSNTASSSKGANMTDADIDQPLRSYIEPTKNRVISEMASGRTISLGTLVCLVCVCGWFLSGT